MDTTFISDAAERNIEAAADSEQRLAVRRSTPALGHRAVTIASVLIPLGMLAWVAANSVISFDGGMNLMVADSVAHGHGYAWNYSGGTVSPSLVQTSGLFLFVAAAAIKLFGTAALALQAANLVFLGLLLVTISIALRPWPTMRLVGPLAFVFITPGVLAFGLAGYGEFAVGFLMVAAFVLLNAVLEQARRPLLLCSAASTLIGISLSIKSVTVAELPVLAGGFVLVAVCRADVSKSRLAVSALTGVLPVLAFEAYRAAELGSVSAWGHYWSKQLHGIHQEATASTFNRAGFDIAPKGWARIESLAGDVGVHAPVLIVAWLMLPLAVLAASYVRRSGTARSWLAEPRRPLEVLLSGVVALYIPWHVFVSPVDWLRHFEVGVIALGILYLLMACRVIESRGHRHAASSRSGGISRKVMLAAAVAGAVGAASCLGRTAVENGHHLVAPDTSLLRAEQSASRYVAQLRQQGETVCGQGAASAPVLALTSHTSLCDLDRFDRCGSAERTALTNGSVFVVWDIAAATHEPKGPPPSDTYTFTKVAEPSDYASIWKVAPRNIPC